MKSGALVWRRSFEFTCPWCNTQMTGRMTDFGVRREQPWKISAVFETEHDCVTGRR